MRYNNSTQFNTITIHNELQLQWTMKYNYNAQWCTIYNANHHCIQWRLHCATMLSLWVLVVSNNTTMKSCPARRIRPAPAQHLQLLLPWCKLATRLRSLPGIWSRDLTRAVDWSACASRALCMPMLTAVRTTAPDRLGTGFCRMW